ncbi:MAG: STAS/SEC14 domain-containing protein [Halobacteriovoraceae bacterium]|nr:STAS/SEC14 domain-containing protein [Halobacteriovoraceae bacterium]
MFKVLQLGSEKDCLAIEAIGTINKEDYEKTLIPEFEKRLEGNKKVRLLIQFGKEFEGYEAAAAWEDFKFGMKKLNSFGRVAIVSDTGWLNSLTTFFGGFIPCPVEEFKNTQLEDAWAWLNSGDIGIDAKLDYNKGNFEVFIHGPLSSINFSAMRSIVDQYLKDKKELNSLMIHFKSFPGWEDVGSFIDHLSFVKDHQGKIKKVAVISDSSLPKLVAPIAKHFISPELREFTEAEIEIGKKWVDA